MQKSNQRKDIKYCVSLFALNNLFIRNAGVCEVNNN